VGQLRLNGNSTKEREENPLSPYKRTEIKEGNREGRGGKTKETTGPGEIGFTITLKTQDFAGNSPSRGRKKRAQGGGTGFTRRKKPLNGGEEG